MEITHIRTISDSERQCCLTEKSCLPISYQELITPPEPAAALDPFPKNRRWAYLGSVAAPAGVGRLDGFFTALVIGRKP